MKNNLVFLLLLIFVFLTGILSATVYFNRQKIFTSEKNNEKESISPTTQLNNQANQQETITQKLSPTQTSTPTKSEFNNWKSYSNNRFGYQFKYDPTWFLSPKCETDDYCFVQGDISQKGWPDISVGKVFYTGITDLSNLENKLKSDFVDASIKQVVFSPQEIPAVFVSFARSPQAYASENYYFFHKGEILKISLNDTDSNQAQKIYNFFLLNFKLLND